MMPRPYSADLRERVLADCEAGLGRAAAARRYRLGERTVYRWLAEAHHEGRREAKPHAGGRRSPARSTSCTTWSPHGTTPHSRSRPRRTRRAPGASSAPRPCAAPSSGSG